MSPATESNIRDYEETATTATGIEGDAWEILGYMLVDAPPQATEAGVLGREDVQEALSEALAELRQLKSQDTTDTM